MAQRMKKKTLRRTHINLCDQCTTYNETITFGPVKITFNQSHLFENEMKRNETKHQPKFNLLVIRFRFAIF